MTNVVHAAESPTGAGAGLVLKGLFATLEESGTGCLLFGGRVKNSPDGPRRSATPVKDSFPVRPELLLNPTVPSVLEGSPWISHSGGVIERFDNTRVHISIT